MASQNAPTVRVIVRIPTNRTEQSPHDPPPIVWNSEKENHLWDVIARSRATESATPDWKALASRLDVPLPYLLYRAQTRYEQDLRGLQDIGGALSPPSLHIDTTITEGTPRLPDRLVSLRRQTLRGGVSPISSPSRLGAPLGVRARLNSLGTNSPARLNRVSSSSILTLQGHRKESGGFRPTSPLSSGSESDENEIANKEEEAERQLGEQEELDNKLKALEQMMTDENLGLVSSLRGKTKGKGKEVDRGRVGTPSTSSLRRDIIQERPRHGTMSSSASRQSLSSASSPPGSIPSMPSPPPDSQSPMSRHFSPGKSRSPPSVSTRNVRGHSHMRLNGLVMTGKASEKGSNHGSSASSFSDISDASLSPSALESALLSKGSRLSSYSQARSYLTGRGAGGHH